MATIEPVFNHLVLPVKLPGHQDKDPEVVSGAILSRLLNACVALGQLAGDEWVETLETVQRSLSRCQGIGQRIVEAKQLLYDWSDLRARDLHILHLTEQNAALLVRRR